MPIFDKTLIDPSDRELEKALREGVKAADHRCRKNRVGWPPKGYAGFRRELAAPEGWRHWSGGEEGPSSRLVVVWWTDFAGRRHYRVAGGRAAFGGDDRLGDMVFERATWPPLALLDGRTFLHSRGGRERLLALCPCGAFGEPREVGWMGGQCGPCHDRAESGDAPAVGARFWAHEGAASFIRCLAFAPDGKTLASAWDDEVRLWDVDSGEVRASARIEGSFVSSLAYSPDGTTLAAAATEVYFLSPRSAGLRKSLPIKGGDSAFNVWDLAYLPDGTRLCGRQGSRPFLLDPEKGKCVPLGEGYDLTGHSCCLRPDGMEAVLSNQSWQLRFWGLPDGRLREAPPWFEEQEQSREQITDPTWSPDGRLFAAIVKPDEETYRLRLWDVAAGRARCDWLIPWAGNGWHTTFAPDGRTLVASKGETLTAYDVGGEELASLVRISPGISALAFSSDGKLLATGGHDNAIRLWPVEVLRRP